MTAEYSTTADDGLVGCVLGNYRITNLLSVGGMGSVYRAQHELLDRPAAIKLLRPELTESDDLVQRFFNEAKAATAIRHPGIVEVYDFGYAEDGRAYLIMELIDGQPLSQVIAERGQFPEHEAAQITRSIASALKAAHAKGIIHRDLKPDNVFLVPDPDGRDARVKVLDFGIAKLANPPPSDRRRTQTGVLMGTPKYMAPEQAREAGTIDQRADIYSLGCILYELLVGQPPFLAEGAGEIIAMQLFTEPEPPSRRARVSPEMDRLVLRLLAKEPAARPASAVAMMDELTALFPEAVGFAGTRDSREIERVSSARALLDTLPQTPSAPLLARASAPRRSRWPFALAGLALAIAGAAAALILSREAPRAAPPVAAPPAPAPIAETPPVSAPLAAVPPPAPLRVAPRVPPPMAKKKPAAKPGAKLEAKIEAKIEAKTETKVEATKAAPLQTDNQSPYELDVGDAPRKPKAP